MNIEKVNKQPKEIYVRVVKLDHNAKNIDADLSRLKNEYDSEGRGWNVLSGGSVGATIGLISCLVTSAAGVPVTSPEMAVLVGGSLLFGVIAGFILY